MGTTYLHNKLKVNISKHCLHIAMCVVARGFAIVRDGLQDVVGLLCVCGWWSSLCGARACPMAVHASVRG